ncbi:hypothetical protein Tco_0912889 [Tanacetum coccineum]
MPFPSEAEVDRLLALPTPPPSPLISLSPPSAEESLARCLAAPALPSSTSNNTFTICSLNSEYGFIGTLDAETRRQRAEVVGYGIRDVWVDPTEVVEEVAPTNLEGFNARVTEPAKVQEEDTQDLYALESLTATLIAHVLALQGQLSAALRQIQALQTRDQTHAGDREGAGSSA